MTNKEQLRAEKMTDSKTATEWKGKRVLVFKFKEFHGFIPKKTGVVVEETDDECLVSFFFGRIWTKKHFEVGVSSVCGYAKLLNS